MLHIMAGFFTQKYELEQSADIHNELEQSADIASHS